jgi:hypothetical protein
MSQLIKPGTHPTITELFIKRIPVFECEAVIDYGKIFNSKNFKKAPSRAIRAEHHAKP